MHHCKCDLTEILFLSGLAGEVKTLVDREIQTLIDENNASKVERA